LRKAAELDPLSAQTLDALDHVLVSVGRYDEELNNCRHIQAQNPNDDAAE
jgi:hypothetical protein